MYEHAEIVLKDLQIEQVNKPTSNFWQRHRWRLHTLHIEKIFPHVEHLNFFFSPFTWQFSCLVLYISEENLKSQPLTEHLTLLDAFSCILTHRTYLSLSRSDWFFCLSFSIFTCFSGESSWMLIRLCSCVDKTTRSNQNNVISNKLRFKIYLHLSYVLSNHEYSEIYLNIHYTYTKLYIVNQFDLIINLLEATESET